MIIWMEFCHFQINFEILSNVCKNLGKNFEKFRVVGRPTFSPPTDRWCFEITKINTEILFETTIIFLIIATYL